MASAIGASALTLCACFGAGGTAQAQQPIAPPSAPTLPKLDPAFDAAKGAFEALPDPIRHEIQEALVWTGDLYGSADGSFGPRTYEAIQDYQRRVKAAATGVLDGAARQGLAAAAKRAQGETGFRVQADAATGAILGVPEKTLPKRDANPRGGSRWQSADGKITLDTRAIPAGETDLPTLYERNLAIQMPGRQVTYKVLRPSFFVIAGETLTGKFYSRYATGPAGIRGFGIGYDKAVAPEFERLVVAIANSFVPFPDPARLAALNAPAPAAAPVAAPPTPAPQPVVQAPPKPARPVLMGTALVVAPGQALTSAALDSCNEPRVAGIKARLTLAREGGLRLLAFEGGPKPATLSRAGTAPGGDMPVIAVAISTSFGAPTPVAAPGVLHGGQVSAPLQAGAGGAPVFDQSGGLLGFIGTRPADKRQVAGIVPASAYGLVPAVEIGRILNHDLPAASGERSTADLMADVAGAVVPVECMP